jgi:Fic family protein
MRWLLTFVTEEEKPVALKAHHRRHQPLCALDFAGGEAPPEKDRLKKATWTGDKLGNDGVDANKDVKGRVLGSLGKVGRWTGALHTGRGHMTITEVSDNPLVGYKWRPIEDLTAEERTVLVRADLHELATVWAQQRNRMQDSDSVTDFVERLQRRWAIETGIIERIYSLDRGVTETLIDQGIEAALIPHDATDRDPTLVVEIIRDQKEVLEGLFAFVAGERPLSNSYIRELHQLMLRHQETCEAVTQFGQVIQVQVIKGDWKKLPNNPRRPDGRIHEYAPPEHVAAEMDRLMLLHSEHEDARVPPEIEAAWLHHRFTQIHPFQDGNGRIARALATLIFLKARWFPLVITRDKAVQYRNALEAADYGDLVPLVELFASVEKLAFINALGIAEDVSSRGYVNEVISATRKQLLERRERLQKEWDHAKKTASQLQGRAVSRLEQVSEDLTCQLGGLDGSFEFFVDHDEGGDRSNWFYHQVMDTAHDLGYYANTQEYASWGRLVLQAGTESEILLSIHGIGREYRGVLVASVTFFRRDQTGEHEHGIAERCAASDDLFQINYLESEESAMPRFDEWLEDALVKGLEMWRQGI